MSGLKDSEMKPTQEQVIAWAREADCLDPQHYGSLWVDKLERFAALAYEAGRKDENDACAQPEPEPVAWYYAGSDVEWRSVALDADLDDKQKANCIPLYTYPPQREWVGLTDEEIQQILWKELGIGQDDDEIAEFARAIEAKLKEKNA